jgi:16S rRNA processing protein RimM
VPDLLEIGRVDRSQGLRGEVVVNLVTNRTERLDPGTHLVASSQDGRRRDLVVATSRPHGHRHVVQFETISTREQSDALHGWLLLAAPLPDEDPDDLYVHGLIGSRVVDTAGTLIGTITSVEANPASDLLVVDGKWYVPARFVVGRSEGEVVVDPPEGLFE